MTVLADTHPTLLDLARISDPDGKISTVVELLNQTNEVLDQMVWLTGNLPTGHQTTVRTGLPTATWRKLYGGVQPSKGKTAKITDSTGNLEAYAEVDKALADLNGNTAAFRLSEDMAHIESMNQEMVGTIFYGNEGSEPEAFTGLTPRYNDSTADNASNLINGGSAVGQTDNTSIWLVVWGPNTVHGIVPKGFTAGITVEDKGQVTIEDIDGAGGRMEAYRTWYVWRAGLTVRDWRYAVRIANIDKSLLTVSMSTGADLADLMFQAIDLIPNLNMGRAAFYMSRTVRSMLRRQVNTHIKNATLSFEDVGGRRNMVSFQGIPIYRVDALAADEARVAFE